MTLLSCHLTKIELGLKHDEKNAIIPVGAFSMHMVQAKSILSPKNGMNIYRGCTHGCIYCDSRSECYGMKHPFENVEVKANAPELLAKALSSKRSRCMIGTGSMSDPYIPIEEELKLTRRCLKIIAEQGFGLSIQTKSDLILRDMDLLRQINEKSKCVVQMTLTTADDELCKIVEPGVCTTRRRFEVLKKMHENGIPTIVWLSPILPWINDSQSNVNGILSLCARAQVRGVICFGMGLALRNGNREYFYEKLDENFKGLSQRYRSAFGSSYECSSPNQERLMNIFYDTCRIYSITSDLEANFRFLSEFPDPQLSLLF